MHGHYRTVALGIDIVFHLHGFEHHHGLSFLHGLSHVDSHGIHRAGQRGTDGRTVPDRDFGLRCRCGSRSDRAMMTWGLPDG